MKVEYGIMSNKWSVETNSRWGCCLQDDNQLS